MIELIVDSSMLIPGGVNTFKLMRYPSHDMGNVAFWGGGGTPLSERGIYLVRDGIVTVVADNNTSVPNDLGTFGVFGGFSLNGSGVSFEGSPDPTSPLAIYLAENGILTVVVDVNIPIPGGLGNFTGFEHHSLHSGGVAFVGDSETSRHQGVYLAKVGTITVIADENTPIPGGSGNFNFFHLVAFDGVDVAFRANGPSGQDGIYRTRNGVLTVVADKNTFIPGGSGNFTGFTGPSMDSGNVAFLAYGFDQSGIYLDIGGAVLMPVADRNTHIPGGSGNFAGFGNPSVDGGAVAFPGGGGIYLASGGLLEKVIDLDDSINNKAINHLNAYPEALSGKGVAVTASHTDGTVAVYKIGVTVSLSITMVSDLVQLLAPDFLTFTIIVGNTGLSMAGAVVVTYILPEGARYAGSPAEGWLVGGDRVERSLGNVHSGTSQTILLTVAFEGEGVFNNTVTVTDGIGHVDNDTATVAVGNLLAADPGGPYGGEEGSEISFDGSVSIHSPPAPGRIRLTLDQQIATNHQFQLTVINLTPEEADIEIRAEENTTGRIAWRVRFDHVFGVIVFQPGVPTGHVVALSLSEMQPGAYTLTVRVDFLAKRVFVDVSGIFTGGGEVRGAAPFLQFYHDVFPPITAVGAMLIDVFEAAPPQGVLIDDVRLNANFDDFTGPDGQSLDGRRPPGGSWTWSVEQGSSLLSANRGRILGSTGSAYVWNFGDGGTGEGSKPDHAYLQAGVYPVSLTITDARGSSDTKATTASIIAPVIDPTLPTIFFVDPDSATEGSSGIELSVNGSGFDAEATVLFHGTQRPTTFVNSGLLLATISAADLASAGDGVVTVLITVRNANLDLSNATAFTVVQANIDQAVTAAAEPGKDTSVSTAPTEEGEVGVVATLSNGGTDPVTVTVAQYTDNVAITNLFDVGGTYVKLQIAGTGSNLSITTRFYYPSTISGGDESRLNLLYFTGSRWARVRSSGNTTPTKDRTDNQDGTISGGSFAVTFDGTSQPSVSDLTT